ncbi:hypothetical protein JOC83_002328 [Bacillus iocasae]|uniref:NADH dehydrogenase subunit 4L n=1 Tax=Priestia iocasae TaxID=2291674 RepID=A0ABS2QVG3_9BACI|nr:hypothetical protein [Metabacillus iocasae]
MAHKMNFYSFIASFVCLELFLLVSFTSIFHSIENLLAAHLLTIVLIVTIISFFTGLIGFSGMKDWKSSMRSFTTVLLTLE